MQRKSAATHRGPGGAPLTIAALGGGQDPELGHFDAQPEQGPELEIVLEGVDESGGATARCWGTA